MMRRGLIALLAVAPQAILAETLYVTDQVTIAIRADTSPTAPVVKTISTGAALEVVEHGQGLVRVRDAQGAEGWVEAAALLTQPPAAAQTKSLRAELDRTRAQLVQAQTQLDKSRATSATAVEPLQAELAAVRTQLAQAQADLQKSEERAQAETVAAADPSAPLPAPAEAGAFSWVWAAVAFAMLLVGFFGGVVWVRESIRRRMGGLYLRI